MRIMTVATGALALGMACGGCRMVAGRISEIPAADIYIAADGNDVWSGTLPTPNADRSDGPFASFGRAREAARALKQKGTAPERGITVVVRGGHYVFEETFTLDSRDSGAAGAPVVYRACPGETVRLSGGSVIPPESFAPLEDDSVRTRLEAGVRDRVLLADLAALGIDGLGTFPVKFRGAADVPELFFNAERMRLARWPNEGWTTIGKIIEAGACPRRGDGRNLPGIFEYTGDRPSRWNVKAGVWLQGYYCFDWYDETIKVGAIDPEKHQVTFAAPAHYSLRQGNPSPRRYRAINVLEELTEPGEYYIDRAMKRLYFLPPARLAGSRTVLSTLRGPVIALDEVSHIVLRGFTVEATLANGIDVKGGIENRIEACEVRNTRELGIHVSGGRRHVVEACDVHDTGTGGITLDGGDRKTLTRGDHEALNCHVWRFSRHQQTYANAFALRGVGNRVAHCLIHDAPHQAVTVAGNDHVFEYNVVHHVAMETDDCGAFYKGRNPSCRGNVVRYNFWHHIGSPMGHGNAAVYFDDGDGGDFVIGNVFFRCGEPGKGRFGTVFSHGGHDLLAENNIFVECKRALGSSPWNDTRWKNYLKGKLWQERLLKEVDITKAPYTTHYPALVGFMEPKPGQKRVNTAKNNVIVMGAQVKSGNWEVSEDDNWVTGKDPGFVAMKKGDFRLRPDAAVYERLPGFEPIPFEKMGLYADPLRPNPPREKWRYAAPKPLPVVPGPTPPKPKSGPAPVFKVSSIDGPVTVDGIVDAAEWLGKKEADAMVLAQDVGGHPAKRQSRAWLGYSKSGLYIAVDNTAHPDTTFGGSQWGADDAVEVSLRPSRKGSKPPIAVIRGYGNGTLQFGTAASGPDTPSPKDPGGIRYAAKVLARDRWMCEFYIPFEAFGFVPDSDRRIAFNLSVRKALDNLWLMWEGTRAHSYDVDRAGFLELVP